MLAVLREWLIVKKCYKFGSPPTIMQSLVLTLVSWTQKVQYCLQLIAFIGFTLSHWKGIALGTFLFDADLNTQTLPSYLIDLDRLLSLAADYNFRHRCCYYAYHKSASFYNFLSMIYFWAFLAKPWFVLTKEALWCPRQRRLTVYKSRYLGSVMVILFSEFIGAIDRRL